MLLFVPERVRGTATSGKDESESERAALRRVGLAALGVGLPILFVGLALYTLLHRTHATDFLRIHVGNGILLVTAWVGLWYPLDTLLHYDRPYRQELQVLRRRRQAELVIKAAPAGVALAPRQGQKGQQRPH